MNQPDAQALKAAPEVVPTSRKPVVSVLMSVYNAGEFLRPSVLSILAQSYRHLELIIIDDGCTDGCLDTITDIQDERVVRLAQENRGKATALNLALTIARGEFFATQDADDFSFPRRIELQVNCLLDNPDVAVVFTGREIIQQSERVAPAYPERSRDECAWRIAKMEVPGLDPTGMYRRTECAHELFEPSLRVGQVYDYILRIGEGRPMLVLGECLYSYRFHWHSVTKRDPEIRKSCIAKVFERAGQRRGASMSTAERQPALNPWQQNNRERDNNLASFYIDSVIDSRRRGDVWLALRTGVKCLLLHPLDPHYYKALLYGIAPLLVLQRIGRKRGIGGRAWASGSA